MYIGVSKRIAKGLRIGTAINTKSWDSDGDGSTAAERRASDRDSFLSGLKRRFDNAVTDAALSSGYLAKPEEFLKLDLSVAGQLRPIADAFYLQHRLASDGGTLTAKRKEDMLKEIYAAEDAVKAISPVHPLKALKADYERVKGKHHKGTSKNCLKTLNL